MNKYNIYANLRLIASVDTEKKAWKVIGSFHVGTCYEVRNEKGEVRKEFIPI